MNREVEVLLERAGDLPPDLRPDFLERECPDPIVKEQVTRLLRDADDAEAFFDRAIRDVATSLTARHEPVVGDRVGSYRIVSLIGRGGMGSVYLAERADGEIQQKVAVKLLRADSGRAGWRERFLKERQLLATLQHSAVVHVMDAGHTEAGCPFLVMEYVDGLPIDAYASRISVRERLQLFLAVCEGVSHAHRHLIIHRDLKPSNILVDRAGQPKVLDFGIAKLQTEADVTQAAEKLLTPNYASPEQLRGDKETTATDVFSLGAVLYKLLTGTTPRAETPPSRLNPEVPGDLDFVIGKALRQEAEHRYHSVGEFAADVRAVLERRPVQARAGNSWYRARRFLRRYWILFTAAALVVASLSVGLLLAERQRRIAERRFTEVRQLANKLFDIDVQVAQLPGGSKTRQLIVETALEYLKRVSADVSLEPGLALELGTAYVRVARVQGVNISPNLGQTSQADAAEQKAQALVDSVLAHQPANRTALLRAGQIAHDRMILAGDAHREEDALRLAHVAVDRLDQYLRVAPLNAASDRADAQQVILALINIGNRYLKAGQSEEAIRICERAIRIAHATNWRTQAGAAGIVVAMAHRSRGELEEAVAAIREAIWLLRPASEEIRTGSVKTYGLALLREGQILGEPHAISLRQPEAAAERYSRVLELGLEFAKRDPSDFQSQYRVFLAETKLAAIVWNKEPARALQMYDDGLRRLASTPANGGTLRNETTTLAASVYPLLRLGRGAEARKRLDGALDRLKQLREYPAEKIEPDSPAEETLRALAEFEAFQGNHGGAADVYAKLIAGIQASGAKPENDLDDAVRLSEIYDSAASFHKKAGKIERAAALRSQSLALWTRWASKSSGNAFVQRQFEAARLRTVHRPTKRGN